MVGFPDSAGDEEGQIFGNSRWHPTAGAAADCRVCQELARLLSEIFSSTPSEETRLGGSVFNFTLSAKVAAALDPTRFGSKMGDWPRQRSPESQFESGRETGQNDLKLCICGFSFLRGRNSRQQKQGEPKFRGRSRPAGSECGGAQCICMFQIVISIISVA